MPLLFLEHIQNNMILDTSYGVIPIKQENKEIFFLLILHSNGMFWGFPKGHQEERESPLEAMERELYEETFLKIKKLISTEFLEERYVFKKEDQSIEKRVFFMVAEVEGDVKIDGKEVLEYRWCNYLEAKELISFHEGKELLDKAQKLIHSKF